MCFFLRRHSYLWAMHVYLFITKTNDTHNGTCNNENLCVNRNHIKLSRGWKMILYIYIYILFIWSKKYIFFIITINPGRTGEAVEGGRNMSCTTTIIYIYKNINVRFQRKKRGVQGRVRSKYKYFLYGSTRSTICFSSFIRRLWGYFFLR